VGIAVGNQVIENNEQVVKETLGDNTILEFEGANTTEYTISALKCDDKTCSPVRMYADGVIDTTFTPTRTYEECVENVTEEVETFSGELGEEVTTEVVDTGECKTYETKLYTREELQNQIDRFEQETLDRIDLRATKKRTVDTTTNIINTTNVELISWEDVTAQAYDTRTAYEVGNVVTYNGETYVVLQAHTPQSDWTPDTVPALYKKVTTTNEPIPQWTQPTGAQDAYNIGDRVVYNGVTYESTIDANVWSPTAYPQGWQQI